MRLRGLVVSVALVVLMGGTALAQTLGIASTAPGSFTHSTASAIAKVIVDKAGLQAVVQPQGAVAVIAVDAGTIDLGLTNSFDATFFAMGTGDYEGQGRRKNFQVVANMTPLRVGMFVRKDSAVKSIRDLKGHRVSAGFNAQKTIGRIISAHLANAGLSYDDVQKVLAPNVVVAADDFASGKTDTLFFALGSAKVKQISAAVGGLRALSIDPAPDAVARMRKILPGSYPMTVEPSKALDGVTVPTRVIAFDFLLLVHSTVSDAVVYRVVKAIHDNKKELVATFRGLRLFSPDHMAGNYEGLEYHPGAIKYYRESGQWPPKD